MIKAGDVWKCYRNNKSKMTTHKDESTEFTLKTGLKQGTDRCRKKEHTILEDETDTTARSAVRRWYGDSGGLWRKPTI